VVRNGDSIGPKPVSNPLGEIVPFGLQVED